MATRTTKTTSSTTSSTTAAKAPAIERRSDKRLQRTRVLVTGASSAIGRAICRVLHRRYDVIAVDARPFPDRPKDVEHVELDLRRKAAQTLFKRKKPELVVHIGPVLDPRRGARGAALLETTATLLKLVEEVGARKLVYLSSALLYGPSPTSAAFLTEEAPLLAGQAVPRLTDAISIDMMVQSFFWKRPETETVVLRPVHVVGPHLDTLASRFLRARRVPTMLGFDPMMQLLHEDDLVEAVVRALEPGMRGVFNVVGATQAPLSRLIAARGATQMPVPSLLLGPTLRRGRALRLFDLDPAEIVHLKYSCLVDGSRAHDGLGFTPRRTLAQTLADLG